MPKIFLSYRRADSQVVTDRMYSRLTKEFGSSNIFRDINAIPLGADFRDVIEREISSCEILLAVIGPQWATITDPNGQKRLDNPDDFVRIEVETALRIPSINVIPVLVSGAQMPTEADIPSTLRKLPYRNAAVVRNDPDFDVDMNRLVASIRGTSSRRWLWAVLALLVVVAVAAILILSRQTEVDTLPTLTAQAALVASNTPVPTDPSPTDTPVSTDLSVPTSTPATIAVSMSGLVIGGLAEVRLNPSINHLNVRSAADQDGLVRAELLEGEVVTILDGPVAADGFLWWKVRTAGGMEGWAVEAGGGHQTLMPLAETPTPINTASLSPPGTARLHLFVTPDSLTLYVPERVSLAGLALVVLINNQQTINGLESAFSILSLTGAMADANTCFVYELSDTSPVLASSCTGQVFKLTVAPADRFWYDAVNNRQRDVAIFRAGVTTGQLCSSALADCAFEWATAVASATTQPAPPSPTVLVRVYPCEGQIVFTTGAMLDQVKISPQRNAPPRDPVQQGSTISILARRSNDGIDWYQISYDNNTSTGWIPVQYVVLSATCP